MRIEKENQKKSEIRNPQSEIPGPMLFARNGLASGPQAYFFAEKTIAKLNVRKERFRIDPQPPIQ
jgi:hypothetical protein